MRRFVTQALLRACSGASALVVLLAVVVSMSYEHDLAYAQDGYDSAMVAEVLAATENLDAVRSTISRTEAGKSGRLKVVLANGETLGLTSGAPAVVRPVLAADGRPASVSVVPSAVPFPLGTFVLALITALIGVVSTLALGVRSLRPVTRALVVLAETAKEGHGRVRVHGPVEIENLAEAVNAAIDRTDELLAKERAMIADVSHRLRTPLTALRLDAELIGEGAASQRVRFSVAALEQSVNQIINSLQAGTMPATTPHCDLVVAVAERMTFWSAYATTQRRPFDLLLPEGPAPVPLPREQVDAVVDTLLANVFQHTPPSAPVTVEVARHAGWVTLVVEDGGPGFAEPRGALRRGSSGGGSTGLGLDIARSAAESTGGRIIIDKGPLGGARVRLKVAETGRDQCPEDPLAWRLWSRSHGRSPSL
ncbi:signal transduction histidine kinase [Lentzea atacamensis]|uniref:Signal transduction histidine-protein kinase/phosphatase MprB n=1 Tax=Lentzea atacamensis TaxID=531938 RepID=A0A316HUT1_9PSEU|nr:HAMP domain-containing sensor histidine kinase [Lentzea atacamensis]PWK84448.1 signal transduction histidine kinase [Lentzea atacamensis]